MKKTITKKIVLISILILGLLLLVACSNEADVVNNNVSQEADRFKVTRRVVVINTRTDKVEFEVLGKISIDTTEKGKLIILAKTDKDTYQKHIVNLTKNNMYIVEDLKGADVSKYKYEVHYQPKSIIPVTFKKDK